MLHSSDYNIVYLQDLTFSLYIN